MYFFLNCQVIDLTFDFEFVSKKLPNYGFILMYPIKDKPKII